MTDIVMGRKVTLNEISPNNWTQLSFGFPNYFSDLFSAINWLEKDSVTVDPDESISFVIHVIQQVYVSEPKKKVEPKYWSWSYSWSIDPKKIQRLDAFKYHKPILKSWKKNFANKKNMIVAQEEKLREWYIPIYLTKTPVARPSNHVHELKYGLFCLVEIEGKRETRFFPEWSVDQSVFEQARKILKDDQ